MKIECFIKYPTIGSYIRLLQEVLLFVKFDRIDQMKIMFEVNKKVFLVQCKTQVACFNSP